MAGNLSNPSSSGDTSEHVLIRGAVPIRYQSGDVKWFPLHLVVKSYVQTRGNKRETKYTLLVQGNHLSMPFVGSRYGKPERDCTVRNWHKGWMAMFSTGLGQFMYDPANTAEQAPMARAV